MPSRAAKRRAIADKLAADIERLRNEIDDRRRHLAQAMKRCKEKRVNLGYCCPIVEAPSGFAAWSRHAPALARAVGSLARAQMRLPAAEERADRAAMIERERHARAEKIQAANVGYMKRLDALKAGAPSIMSKWAKERADEEKRLADRRKQLERRTHKDQGKAGKSAAVERHWWRRPNLPEPIKQPEPEPADDIAETMPPREGLIPGTFKLVDPSRLGAVLDRPRLPKAWTAKHVGHRLIEAHRVLARMPATIWPKEYGAAWPDYRREWGELVVQAGAGVLHLNRSGRARGATADEVARMNEAISWPLQFLANHGYLAADVNLWAAETSEEEFENDGRGAPWEALRIIADALNAAKEVVR